MKPQPYVVENTHEAARKLAERLAHPLQIGADQRLSGNFRKRLWDKCGHSRFPCRNSNVRGRTLIWRDLKEMAAFLKLMKSVVQEVAEELRARTFFGAACFSAR